jgi:DNA-binding CsgD family transcriptional regulator
MRHLQLDILSALETLFAPGLDPSTFQSRSGEILRSMVPCDIVSFAVLNPETQQLDIDFDPYVRGIDEGLHGFGRHMAAYPCFNFDPAVNGGHPFLRSDFLSDEEFYSSPIYTEGFSIPGISDHAAMLLPSEDNLIVFLGLELCGGARFGEASRLVLEMLQPHLANARNLASALVRLESVTADAGLFQRAGLSPRQAEVLAWLSQGKTNSEIAAIMEIGVPTVKGHVSCIFDRLGVCNRHAAILEAHRLARLPVALPDKSGHASTHVQLEDPPDSP